MGRFLLKRLFQTIIILIIISIISFSLIHIIPGDPVYAMLGTEITEAYHDQVYEEMGLNEPLIVQYTNWLFDFVKGDMGYSYYFRQEVSEVVARRLPVTLYLGLLSAVISVILGILFGVITAVKRGSFTDTVLTVFANIGLATPIFWFGILLIFVFSLKLKMVPPAGFTFPWDNFILSIKQTILPVLCLSIGGVAIYTRQMRSSMLEVIEQDYIRTARSKGLKENKIVYRHAIKNALIPVITIMGFTLRNSIGGSAIIETVFNISGMGRVMVISLNNRDYTSLQSGLLFMAIITCISNLLVDIAYAYVEPRIRLE